MIKWCNFIIRKYLYIEISLKIRAIVMALHTGEKFIFSLHLPYVANWVEPLQFFRCAETELLFRFHRTCFKEKIYVAMYYKIISIYQGPFCLICIIYEKEKLYPICTQIYYITEFYRQQIKVNKRKWKCTDCLEKCTDILGTHNDSKVNCCSGFVDVCLHSRYVAQPTGAEPEETSDLKV